MPVFIPSNILFCDFIVYFCPVAWDFSTKYIPKLCFLLWTVLHGPYVLFFFFFFLTDAALRGRQVYSGIQKMCLNLRVLFCIRRCFWSVCQKCFATAEVQKRKVQLSSQRQKLEPHTGRLKCCLWARQGFQAPRFPACLSKELVTLPGISVLQRAKS